MGCGSAVGSNIFGIASSILLRHYLALIQVSRVDTCVAYLFPDGQVQGLPACCNIFHPNTATEFNGTGQGKTCCNVNGWG